MNDLGDNNNSQGDENFKPLGKEKKDFELELGQKWLGRIGIVTLVVGVALFLIYSLKYFGPEGKIAIGLVSAAILTIVGFFVEKKYDHFGQTLFGGGVSLAYFTVYASHYFEESKIIDNQYITLGVLSALALSYLFYTLKYKNEKSSLVSLVLVFITVNLGAIANFSLVALTVFSAICLAVFSKYGWKIGYAATLMLSYFTLARWTIPIIAQSDKIALNEFYMHFGILAVLFLLFSAAHFVLYNKESDGYKDSEDMALIVTNLVATYGFGQLLVSSTFDDKHSLFLLSYAILCAVIAAGMRFLSNENFKARAYLGVATGAIFFYIPQVTDNIFTTTWWLVLGTLFLLYGTFYGTIKTRLVGSGIVVISICANLFFFMDKGDDIKYIAGILFLIAALVLEGANTAKKTLSNGQEKLDAKSQTEEVALQRISATMSVVSLGLAAYAITGKDYLTLAWGVLGFTIPLIGFALKDKYFRRAGLFFLLFAIVKLFAVDLSNMDIIFRIISFIILGSLLLLLSFVYTKYKDKIEKYI